MQGLLGSRRVSEADLAALAHAPTANAPPTPPETPKRKPADPIIQPELQCSLAVSKAQAFDRPLINARRSQDDVQSLVTRASSRPLPIEVTLDDHPAEDQGGIWIGMKRKRSFGHHQAHDSSEWTSSCAPRRSQVTTALIKKAELDAWSM